MPKRGGIGRPLFSPAESLKIALNPSAKYDCSMCMDTGREDVTLDDDRALALGYCEYCRMYCPKCKSWVKRKEHKPHV